MPENAVVVPDPLSDWVERLASLKVNANDVTFGSLILHVFCQDPDPINTNRPNSPSSPTSLKFKPNLHSPTYL